MKIYTMEVMTDLGRRVVQLSPPIDVDPIGDMPQPYRSLAAVLWGVLCGAAEQPLVPTVPKAEA